MADNLTMKVVWDMLDKITKPLKTIQASGGATAKALKQTRDQLRELNNQQKAVGEFRELQSGLKGSQQRLRETQERVRQLAQNMRAVESPTRAMAREFDRAVTKARAVKDQVQQQGRQLQSLRDRLSAAGISTQNLGTHERTLRANIAATNTQLEQQQKKLAAVTRQHERMQKARSAYGRGIQTAAAMAGTGMAARGTGMYTGEKLRTMLGVGYEFDATMSATQAVTRIKDKNDADMQALRLQARTLPLSSKYTDSQVAQGQYFLGRTGYNAKQILGAMPGMLNLAAAGDMDLGETADIASNIQVAMGIPAEKMGRVADVLTAAFTRNNVDIRMLGDSLKYSAGVGREYGQSLETVTAATALLGNAGVQGSMAGTSMRSVFTRIGNSTTVKRLGVNTADKDGNLRDLLDILRDINEKTKGMGSVQRGAVYKSIAGQYAVTSFGTLMRAVENGQFQTMRSSLEGSSGEAAQVAIPRKGEKIALRIGWEDEGLVNKGSFIVDEVEHSGTPDQITLRARTADLLDDFRELRERSFHDTTIGAVIDAIAAAHELKSGASPKLRSRKIEHIDQTSESDANFLRRLGKQFDAVATVKNDTLLFSPAGESKTVSGKPLPVIAITRGSGDHHRFHAAERDTYTGVRVFWYDQKHNARFSVVAGRSGNAKRLRTIYASKDDAIQAARAEWQRVQRGIHTFQLDLAIARPQIMPQSPVQATGWKPIIDDTEWMTVRVSTRVDANGGMSQSIELETVAEESDDAPIEPLEDPDKGITGVSATWLDKIGKKKGEELAGKAGNVKKLSHIYATKYSAQKGAKLEWAKITERRELIAEHSQ